MTTMRKLDRPMGSSRHDRRLLGRARSRRGVAFVYFTVVAMPLVFLAMAFAVDFTRIIITQRNMTNVAAASAAAGSWQFRGDYASLDPAKAPRAATETFCESSAWIHNTSPGERGGTVSCPDGRKVSVQVTLGDYRGDVNGVAANGYTTVKVTSRYKIDNLLFFRYFGSDNSVDVEVTQQASVCFSGDTEGYTGGYCSRPN